MAIGWPAGQPTQAERQRHMLEFLSGSGRNLPEHLTIEQVEEWGQTYVYPNRYALVNGCATIDESMSAMVAMVREYGPDGAADAVADLEGKVCPGCFAQARAAHVIVSTAFKLLYPGQEFGPAAEARKILNDADGL